MSPKKHYSRRRPENRRKSIRFAVAKLAPTLIAIAAIMQSISEPRWRPERLKSSAVLLESSATKGSGSPPPAQVGAGSGDRTETRSIRWHLCRARSHPPSSGATAYLRWNSDSAPGSGNSYRNGLSLAPFVPSRGLFAFGADLARPIVSALPGELHTLLQFVQRLQPGRCCGELIAGDHINRAAQDFRLRDLPTGGHPVKFADRFNIQSVS